MSLRIRRIHPAAAAATGGDDRNRSSTVKTSADDDDDQISNIIEEEGGRDMAAPARMRWVKLTVWKRSSMSFQGTDGFTVFDEQGSLVFRMDNYSRRPTSFSDSLLLLLSPHHLPLSSDHLLLMDGIGNALLTFKQSHQTFSLHQWWNAYKGEDGCAKDKLFSMRSSSLLPNSPSTPSGNKKNNVAAEIFMGPAATSSRRRSPRCGRPTPDFRIEGLFRSRDCKIRSHSTGQVVAKITRKRVANSTILLGDDVFTLLVHPAYDPQLVMAFLIILDRITYNCKPAFCTPILCS